MRHNPGWELKFANYAIPDQGAEPTAQDVADLVAAFREHDRLPRLEFLPAWAPAVEPALLAAGFTVENRAPVMACTADDLLTSKPVDGLRIAEPVTDAEFASAAAVQHTGFGGEGGPDDGEIAWLRRATESGASRDWPPWTAGPPERAAARPRPTGSANWPVWPSPTPSAAGASARRSPPG